MRQKLERSRRTYLKQTVEGPRGLGGISEKFSWLSSVEKRSKMPQQPRQKGKG